MPGNLAPFQHVEDPRVQQNFDQIYQSWPVGEYIATSLPAGVVTGQTTLYQTAAMAALTPPVMWRLWYVAGVGWFPIGAVPLFAETGAYTTIAAPDQGTASVPYVALATAGPVVQLPAPGWYDIEIAFGGYHTVAGNTLVMSYDIDATGALDVNSASVQPAVAVTDIPRVTRTVRKQFAAASLLTAKYRTTAATGTWRGPRTMKATPVLL